MNSNIVAESKWEELHEYIRELLVSSINKCIDSDKEQNQKYHYYVFARKILSTIASKNQDTTLAALTEKICRAGKVNPSYHLNPNNLIDTVNHIATSNLELAEIATLKKAFNYHLTNFSKVELNGVIQRLKHPYQNKYFIRWLQQLAAIELANNNTRSYNKLMYTLFNLCIYHCNKTKDYLPLLQLVDGYMKSKPELEIYQIIGLDKALEITRLLLTKKGLDEVCVSILTPILKLENIDDQLSGQDKANLSFILTCPISKTIIVSETERMTKALLYAIDSGEKNSVDFEHCFHQLLAGKVLNDHESKIYEMHNTIDPTNPSKSYAQLSMLFAISNLQKSSFDSDRAKMWSKVALSKFDELMLLVNKKTSDMDIEEKTVQQVAKQFLEYAQKNKLLSDTQRDEVKVAIGSSSFSPKLFSDAKLGLDENLSGLDTKFENKLNKL